MGLDNLDQNYYSKTFPGTSHPWSNTEPLQNRKQLELGMKVYHKEVYEGKELLEVVGIRKNEVELYGDYSGMCNSYGSQWLSLDGLMVDQSRQTVNVKISNFSEEFKKSDAMLNPIVVSAIHMLQQGNPVYKVLEMVMTQFVKINSEQFEIMKQLIENCGQPFMIPKK